MVMTTSPSSPTSKIYKLLPLNLRPPSYFGGPPITEKPLRRIIGVRCPNCVRVAEEARRGHRISEHEADALWLEEVERDREIGRHEREKQKENRKDQKVDVEQIRVKTCQKTGLTEEVENNFHDALMPIIRSPAKQLSRCDRRKKFDSISSEYFEKKLLPPMTHVKSEPVADFLSISDGPTLLPIKFEKLRPRLQGECSSHDEMKSLGITKREESLETEGKAVPLSSPTEPNDFLYVSKGPVSPVSPRSIRGRHTPSPKPIAKSLMFDWSAITTSPDSLPSNEVLDIKDWYLSPTPPLPPRNPDRLFHEQHQHPNPNLNRYINLADWSHMKGHWLPSSNLPPKDPRPQPLRANRSSTLNLSTQGSWDISDTAENRLVRGSDAGCRSSILPTPSLTLHGGELERKIDETIEEWNRAVDLARKRIARRQEKLRPSPLRLVDKKTSKFVVKKNSKL